MLTKCLSAHYGTLHVALAGPSYGDMFVMFSLGDYPGAVKFESFDWKAADEKVIRRMFLYYQF